MIPSMGTPQTVAIGSRNIQVATPPVTPMGGGSVSGSSAPVVSVVPTPPPVQKDSLDALLQRYPVMWQGLLALKNDHAAVQMHFVYGNPNVAGSSLPSNSDGSTPPLRIAQRMRLEPAQIDGVARKMQMVNEHCMLLALPCGRDRMDVLQQQNNLQTGFITYLQQKQAAGIVNIAAPGSAQAAYVVHIFPSCEFANENLARIAPDLMHRVANIQYLLIVIATV
uniref:SPOC domain-containing protein n=2 Tax=Anopheles coluzzii TaxID=1518534 RepID=A0A8W7PD26_ANOCL